MMDSIGWAALLPQMLASLGAVFLMAKVGEVVGGVVTSAVPMDGAFAAVEQVPGTEGCGGGRVRELVAVGEGCGRRGVRVCGIGECVHECVRCPRRRRR